MKRCKTDINIIYAFVCYTQQVASELKLGVHIGPLSSGQIYSGGQLNNNLPIENSSHVSINIFYRPYLTDIFKFVLMALFYVLRSCFV